MGLLFNIDPTQLLTFAAGLVVAWMVARLIVGARAARTRPGTPRRPAIWLQGAIALALLIGLWMFLRG